MFFFSSILLLKVNRQQQTVTFNIVIFILIFRVFLLKRSQKSILYIQEYTNKY